MNKGNKLQDNVILLINGLSESGHVLAKMLAEKGADVGIVDFRHMPSLAHRIQQDVQDNGRRCLILTPDPTEKDHSKFAHYAMKTIIEELGKWDSFITFSAADPAEKADQSTNSHSTPQVSIFDQYALTKTALKQVLTP